MHSKCILRENNVRSKQSGFGLLGIFIVMAIIGAVGVIGILVWQANKTKAPNTTNQSGTSTSTTTGTSSNLSPLLYATYTSKTGGFTMKYLKGWTIKGFKAGQPVTTPDGTEDHIRLQEAPDSVKLNNFGGDLIISSTPPGDSPWPVYPNGTVFTTLANGIQLWQDNKTQTLASGQVQNTCPSLRIASNDMFGFQLKNGMYLSYVGSFCWAPDMKSGMSYGQQLFSDEFSQMEKMLGSIKQQ